MKKTRRRWSPEDSARLRLLYPDRPTRDVARELDRTVSAINGQVTTLGLEKSAAYLASPAACRIQRAHALSNPRMIANRFQKGLVPHNKGLHRPGYGPGRMKETQFKKGQAGYNWKPVGSRRVVAGYWYTKVTDRRRVAWTANWKPTHVLLWEKRRGEVPRGHKLRFKNGDRNDIRIGNLECVSSADMMRRNTVHRLPPEIKAAVYALGTLKASITKKRKKLASARAAA